MHTSLINSIWQQLRRINTLYSECSSRLETGWKGRGQGRVDVEEPNGQTLIFNEEGHWDSSKGMRLPFRNVYRWTLKDEQISLSHLRFGIDRSVFLVDLVPAQDRLCAVEPHPCGDDRYDAQLSIQNDVLLLEWTVTGPAKDEHLRHAYRALDRPSAQRE